MWLSTFPNSIYWRVCPILICIFLSPLWLCAESLQLCPPLCDSMDCSLPGSCVHGIPEAWTVEWVTTLSSWESSHPWDQTWQASFLLEPPGKPCHRLIDHICRFLSGLFILFNWSTFMPIQYCFGHSQNMVRKVFGKQNWLNMRCKKHC